MPERVSGRLFYFFSGKALFDFFFTFGHKVFFPRSSSGDNRHDAMRPIEKKEEKG